jgi:uncharacterized protein
MFTDLRFYIFQIIIIVSAILSTFSSFGFTALILLPLSIVFPLEQAIAISGIVDFFNGLTRGWFFKDKVDYKLIIYYGLPAIILAFITSFNVYNFDKKLFQTILGILLIIFGFLKLLFSNFYLPSKRSLLLFGGVISGTLAGFFGAGGILRTAFLSNYKLPLVELIATCTLIEIFIDLSRAIGYITTIPLTQNQWILIFISVITSYLGVKFSTPYAKKISENQFKNIVSILIIIFGILYLIRVV